MCLWKTWRNILCLRGSHAKENTANQMKQKAPQKPKKKKKTPNWWLYTIKMKGISIPDTGREKWGDLCVLFGLGFFSPSGQFQYFFFFQASLVWWFYFLLQTQQEKNSTGNWDRLMAMCLSQKDLIIRDVQQFIGIMLERHLWLWLFSRWRRLRIQEESKHLSFSCWRQK